VPKTLESLREKDETTVETAEPEEMEEVELDLKLDEMNSYFEHSYEPKVMITYSENPGGVSIIMDK
jgi:ribosome production factor 1